MLKQHQALRTLTAAILITGTRPMSSSTIPAASVAPSPNTAFHRPTVPTETNDAIVNLQPTSVWSHFAALSSIPRPSKHENAVLSYIKGFAKSNNLRYTQDETGNLCVFRPGSGGGEDAYPVVLQGHVDMVTEKNNDSEHDFFVDPIRLRKFDDGKGRTWIGARGTTLGADNGIGVAATLALLETPVNGGGTKSLPPLEALFTVDEETGLTGATTLDAKALGLTGRTMLNLDTEEWGDLYVGCAGGGETIVTLPLGREEGTGWTTPGVDFDLVEVTVSGLMGGHSGINIHEGRANAVLLCAAAANAVIEAVGRATEGEERKRIRLVSIHGGDKHNAIPREACAMFAVSREETPEVRTVMERSVKSSADAAIAEFGGLETGLRMDVRDVEEERGGGKTSTTCTHPLDELSSSRLLHTLMALPHGPIKFSHALPDLVETSSNVASVSTKVDSATILCSTRSSIKSALESTRDRICAIASLASASVERSESYPGWNPDPKSPILDVARNILVEKLGGKEPGVKAIHAGLECGLLIEKLGSDVDALSFGPTIMGAHSPDERLEVETVLPFFELVEDILAELARKKKTATS